MHPSFNFHQSVTACKRNKVPNNWKILAETEAPRDWGGDGGIGSLWLNCRFRWLQTVPVFRQWPTVRIVSRWLQTVPVFRHWLTVRIVSKWLQTVPELSQWPIARIVFRWQQTVPVFRQWPIARIVFRWQQTIPVFRQWPTVRTVFRWQQTVPVFKQWPTGWLFPGDYRQYRYSDSDPQYGYFQVTTDSTGVRGRRARRVMRWCPAAWAGRTDCSPRDRGRGQPRTSRAGQDAPSTPRSAHRTQRWTCPE